MRAMTDTLTHRGPDSSGVWVDHNAGIALGHRRLSILDLSSAGHEPMHSPDARYVLTFNGEIYNFEEIRTALEDRGHVPSGGWRGHSDAEVFLGAIAAWGLEPALGKAAGMFAFALWDRLYRRLTLVRDRFGEKPLYYGWAGSDFLFGSELKALRAHPDFDNSIDRRAVALFARRTHVPAPLSIYKGIFKLQPGCALEVTADGVGTPLVVPPEEDHSKAGLRLRRYWSYRDVVRQGLSDPIQDETEAIAELEKVLRTSVRGQFVADVPVGAFLSGGIDTSTITALYQKYCTRPVRTFCIGFEDAGFNEATHAKAVALHLGTLHQELYVTTAEARDVIPRLPAIYDEPFGDSSQIPTHLLSSFARKDVRVALTGDGGDELFGGYNRHVQAPRIWRHLKRFPRPLRAAAAAPLRHVPPEVWMRAMGALGEGSPLHLNRKIEKALAIVSRASSFEDVHRHLVEEWVSGTSPVPGEDGCLPFDLDIPGAADAVRMMHSDAVSYLPDDILCKVDRASMAVGLETRLPFLDHRVAQVAARLPISMKIRRGTGKYILRKLLDRYVPRELVDRPKAGFAIPVGEWIKGPLRAWAEELLEPRQMRSEGWFDPDLVSARWQDHRSGRVDATASLWAVLMFQAWLRQEHTSRAVA